jgi:hypothetical protein
MSLLPIDIPINIYKLVVVYVGNSAVLSLKPYCEIIHSCKQFQDKFAYE